VQSINLFVRQLMTYLGKEKTTPENKEDEFKREGVLLAFAYNQGAIYSYKKKQGMRQASIFMLYYKIKKRNDFEL